ncbi:MAG: RdgB/HAM1 family non-canonical purine NTP pyrophosphatase [Pseudomonadota bacterium]
MSTQVVFASGNAGKLREMTAILEPLGIELIAQREFAIEAVEETGQTFVENAILKARQAAIATGLPALADDSGLVVHSLGGAPGVHSARFAGIGASDDENIDKLLDTLVDHEVKAARSAEFRCVIVFMTSDRDPSPVICDGRWPGHIAMQRSGRGGFGYDPVFVPTGMQDSAASLTQAEKNRVSHRGQALASLTPALSVWLARAD